MIRFSIFSIPVEIQPFFWVTLVILGGVSGADTAAQILEIGLFVIAGFVYATYSGTHLNRWKSFLVTAAGPLAQIALAFIVLFIMQNIPNLTDLGSLFLSTLIFISFFWAILNLLPVLPLDGGQMLNAVLGPARIKITLWISIVVAVTAAIGVFLQTNSYIFPIFLGMFAWQAFQALKQQP